MATNKVTTVEHDMRVRKVGRAVAKVAARNGHESPSAQAVARHLGMTNSGNLHAYLSTNGHDAKTELDRAWQLGGYRRRRLEDFPGLSENHASGPGATPSEERPARRGGARFASKTAQEQSRLAWERVDALLTDGGLSNAELADIIGYASTSSFTAALRERNNLPTAKRDRVAETYSRLNGLSASPAPAPVRSQGDPWAAVAEANAALREALQGALESVPGALVSDRAQMWLKMSEDIGNALGG